MRSLLIEGKIHDILSFQRFTTHRKLGEGSIGVGSIPVAILPSCQDMKTIALECREINIAA